MSYQMWALPSFKQVCAHVCMCVHKCMHTSFKNACTYFKKHTGPGSGQERENCPHPVTPLTAAITRGWNARGRSLRTQEVFRNRGTGEEDQMARSHKTSTPGLVSPGGLKPELSHREGQRRAGSPSFWLEQYERGLLRCREPLFLA